VYMTALYTEACIHVGCIQSVSALLSVVTELFLLLSNCCFFCDIIVHHEP